MRKKRRYTQWEIGDMAFAEYASKRRGLTKPETTKLLEHTDKDLVSLTNLRTNISNFSKGRMDPTSKQYKKIQKALQLEMQVFGGAAPEQKKMWDDRISMVTGIQYAQPVVQEPSHDLDGDEALNQSIPDTTTPVVGADMIYQEKPQTITITFEDILKLITATKGGS